MGILGYLPRDGMDRNLKISLKSSLLSLSTLGEKNTLDLASLTNRPEMEQKVFNTDLMAWQLVSLAFAKRTDRKSVV